MIGEIFLNKDLDAWLKLKFPLTTRTMSSAYVNSQYLKELLDEYKDDIKGYDYKRESIQNFELEYMGNGKLLRLITNNQHPKLRGGGALLLKYENDAMFSLVLPYFFPRAEI